MPDFPRPGMSSITSAVTGSKSGGFGLAIPGLYIDPRFNAVRGAYLDAQRIDRLGMAFTSFKIPLTTALNQVIVPSIIQNFQEQGRPKWQKLSKKTIYNRQMEGFPRGPILQKTGRLKRIATRKNIWYIQDNVLRMRTTYFDQAVPYGEFHQFGAKEARSKKRLTGLRNTLTLGPGSKSEQLASGLQQVFAAGGYVLPARPYIQLTESEEIEIYNIFVAYMVAMVDKYWGSGSDGL